MSQPCGPPPDTSAATSAKGVPAATVATAAWASLWLENSATVKQAVSKAAAWAAKYLSRSCSEEPTPARSSSSTLNVASKWTFSLTKDVGRLASTSLAFNAAPDALQAYLD